MSLVRLQRTGHGRRYRYPGTVPGYPRYTRVLVSVGRTVVVSLPMAAPDDPDFDEEDEELLGNIGEHSLLSRVQRRLWDQLQRKKTRIELELREVAEDADRSRKSREDLGVELYGLQQQLARLQLQLEGAHNNSNLLADIRKKSESDLKRFREVGTHCAGPVWECRAVSARSNAA